MKTDAQLKEEVMNEIKWAACVTAGQVGVSAVDGVVTLNGTVASYAEKWAIERLVQRVEGVRSIAEEINIHFDGSHARAEAESAEAAVSVFK